MIKSKTKYIPYKVKDINEAQWGRDEIKLAESEMPGLMSLRAEYKKSKPFKFLKENTFVYYPFYCFWSSKTKNWLLKIY